MTLEQQLYEKVSAEYNARMDEISQMPPKRIMEHAHEITTKADLLMCFEVGEIEENMARALLTLESPLDHIYEQCMDADSSWYMDRLRECVETEAEQLLRNGKEYVVGICERGPYEIIEKIEVGKKTFLLGHNSEAAVLTYGTWEGRIGQKGDYRYGRYFGGREVAEKDLKVRVRKEQKRLDNRDRGGR